MELLSLGIGLKIIARGVLNKMESCKF